MSWQRPRAVARGGCGTGESVCWQAVGGVRGCGHRLVVGQRDERWVGQEGGGSRRKATGHWSRGTCVGVSIRRRRTYVLHSTWYSNYVHVHCTIINHMFPGLQDEISLGSTVC